VPLDLFGPSCGCDDAAVRCPVAPFPTMGKDD
jgi:hypothetical protein